MNRSKTLLAGILLSLAGSLPSNAAIISEFQPNQPGTGADPLQQILELSGAAGTSFTGFVLAIGGESTRLGTVDTVSPVSGTFDSSGLFTTSVGDFLNPSHTIVLVNQFEGEAGVTDIDTNNDGIADDLSSFGGLSGVEDAIGIPNSTNDEFRLFGEDLGGQDFAFTGDLSGPRLVFRDASVGSWFAINDPDNGEVFDIRGQNVADLLVFDGDPFSISFGRINPRAMAVPEPSSLAVLILVGATVAYRRRRSHHANVDVAH